MDRLTTLLSDLGLRLPELRKRRPNADATRDTIVLPVLHALGWSPGGAYAGEQPEAPRSRVLASGDTPDVLLEIRRLGDSLRAWPPPRSLERARQRGLDWLIVTTGVRWRLCCAALAHPPEANPILDVYIAGPSMPGPTVADLAARLRLMAPEAFRDGTVGELRANAAMDARMTAALRKLVRHPPRSLLRMLTTRMADPGASDAEASASLSRVLTRGLGAVMPAASDEAFRNPYYYVDSKTLEQWVVDGLAGFGGTTTMAELLAWLSGAGAGHSSEHGDAGGRQWYLGGSWEHRCRAAIGRLRGRGVLAPVRTLGVVELAGQSGPGTSGEPQLAPNASTQPGESHHTEGKPDETVALYRAFDRLCMSELRPGAVTRVFTDSHIGYQTRGECFCAVELTDDGLDVRVPEHGAPGGAEDDSDAVLVQSPEDLRRAESLVAGALPG